jgi:hypothetical protein
VSIHPCDAVRRPDTIAWLERLRAHRHRINPSALRKAYPDSGYVFTIERSTPFTTDAINRLINGRSDDVV